MVQRVPVGEAVELCDREAYFAMVEHFGLEFVDTEPMPLEHLPGAFELLEREEDRTAAQVRRAFGAGPHADPWADNELRVRGDR